MWCLWRQGDQLVELLEGLRVVVSGSRLKPRPHQVEPHGVEAHALHLREIRLDVLRIPLQGPLHGRLGRHPVGADHQKPVAVAAEVIAVELRGRQRRGAVAGARAGRPEATGSNSRPSAMIHAAVESLPV